MRWIIALLISFCLTGGVFAQTPSPEATSTATIPQKLLLKVNIFNPWAIMMDDMTMYNVTAFSLYDDGLLIYYGVNPVDDTDYNYYSLMVDAQAFMAQFDMAELATLDDAYIEDGLMDAITTVLEFYVPATDSYKTIEVYGYDNPDSIDALITIIYDFAETPHEDATLWTPQYVSLHIAPVEHLGRIDEGMVLDVEHAFLFDEAMVAVELKSPEELAEGVELILDYQIAVDKLLPLLTADIMYIRTAPNRVWRYWAEIVPYMP